MLYENILNNIGGGWCLAVVPMLLGPLHSLMLVIPQILLGLVLVLSSLLDPLVWRDMAGRILNAMRAKPLRSSLCLVAVAALPWLVWWLLRPSAGAGPITGEVPAIEENWTSFHGGPTRCGTLDSMDVTLTADINWKFRDSSILERRPFACSPAVAGSRVLIGSDNYKLYCLHLETGQPQWTFEARYPIFSSPAVWNGRVYIGEGLHEHTGSKLYCLDLRNGEVLWSIQTNSHTESSPTVEEGKVYFGAGDDGIYCADAVSGEVKWRFPGVHPVRKEAPTELSNGVHVDCCPLVIGERVYFGSGYGSEGIFCLSAADGRLLWKKDLPAPVWGAPSFSEGRLYVTIGNGNFDGSDSAPYGEVRCIDPAYGKDIWRFTEPKDGVLTSVAVSGRWAAFGSRDGACYILDVMTGVLAWRVEVGAPILSSPAIAGKNVVFGANDGRLHCLSLETGLELWSFDTSEDVLIIMEDARILSSPAVVAGKAIFGASNGNVYCLGGKKNTPAGIAQTGYRSRLMRAANFLMIGLINQLARLTGSYGLALVLGVLILKLLLLPIDWGQTRQLSKLRGLQPDIERMKREYLDYHTLRFEMLKLYAEKGVHPLRIIGLVLLQIPLFVIVFLVIQGTSVFAGKSFLWISDLSSPDRLWKIAFAGSPDFKMNLLPLILIGSIWFYSVAVRGFRRGSGLFRWIVWSLVAIGLGTLTYRWASSVLLFFIAMLWIGMLQQKILSTVQCHTSGTGN